MKSAPFAVARPTSVEEAVRCLAEHGTDARLLAGGQSLVPLLAARAVRAGVLVDLDRVPGLEHITLHEDGSVGIGAMVRQRVAEQSTLVAEHVPALAMALPFIAHATVRNQGTIGGSLAHADPGAEIPNIAILSGAEAMVAGPGGVRRIPAGELFVGPMTTTMAADEVLLEVRFPPVPPRSGSAFAEVSRRPGDPAIVAAAALVQLDEAGAITAARVTLSAVGPTPLHAAAAAEVLVGRPPHPDLFAAAASEAALAVDPPTDLHATAAYRRHVTAVLVRRVLAAAVGNAS